MSALLDVLAVVACLLGYAVPAGVTVAVVRAGLRDKDDPLPVIVAIFWPLGLPTWLAWRGSERLMAWREERAAAKAEAEAVKQKRVDAASYRSVE